MIEKLTSDEFNTLTERMFEKYNQPFKVVSVKTVSAGKLVAVQLKDGGKKTVVISLPVGGKDQ